MPCAFCEMGRCLNPSHRLEQRRKQLKALPSAEDYRARRREKLRETGRDRKQALLWETRTGRYTVGFDGVFEGTYLRRDGVWMVVRGSTVAGVRWEREQSSRRWRRVPYRAPT